MTTQLEYWPETQDIRLITELEEDEPQTRDRDKAQPKKSSRPGSTQPVDQDLPRAADESPLADPNQFPILYQDVQLKDKR